MRSLVYLGDEQCIADEKANAVIVTAIPETHKEIEDLLARMEGVLKQEQTGKAAPLQLYQIEVALLQSVEKPASSATPVYMEKLEQPIDSVKFAGEDIDEVVAMLSEYAGENINVEDLAIGCEVTLNIVQPTPLIEVLQLIADMHNLWIDYQPSSLILRWARNETQRKKANPADYGLNPGDLDQFKVKGVSEVGRAIQALTNSPDSDGSSIVSMGDTFQCELEFQDFRDPYLIVKGELQRGDRTLIHSTLFLEKGKPSILAITNMKDTLILVVRLLEIR